VRDPIKRFAVLIIAMVVCLPCATRAQTTTAPNISSLDREQELVGWVQPERLEWQALKVSGLPDAEFKLLSITQSSKARAQITRLPAGWSHPIGYHNTNEEIFLLSGELTIGKVRMIKYSYAYFPAGYAHGPAHTEFGATFLHWWDSDPDFVAAETSKQGTRTDEVVEDWNFYAAPWTPPDKFPKWAAFPPPPDIRLKLLRMDKVTGQMTWIAWFPSMKGYHEAIAKTGGNFWEVHPGWEESTFLEGDMTFGECLPGKGVIVGSYSPGGYFFRPANLRHGGPMMDTNGGSMWIGRTGVKLWADYYPECNYQEKK